MRYDLRTPLRDHRGQEITETNRQESNGAELTETSTVTLGVMLERACLTLSDPKAGADEKYAQYKLAQKIGRTLESGAGFVDFTSEEVTRLKALCAQGYAPIAYGAIVDELEQPLAVSDHELDA